VLRASTPLLMVSEVTLSHEINSQAFGGTQWHPSAKTLLSPKKPKPGKSRDLPGFSMVAGAGNVTAPSS
jgi:hypothetical protein